MTAEYVLNFLTHTRNRLRWHKLAHEELDTVIRRLESGEAIEPSKIEADSCGCKRRAAERRIPDCQATG